MTDARVQHAVAVGHAFVVLRRALRHAACAWPIIELPSVGSAASDRDCKLKCCRQIDTLAHCQTRRLPNLRVRNDSRQWVLQPLTTADAMRIERLGTPRRVVPLFGDAAFDFAAPAGAGVPASASLRTAVHD